MTPRPLMLFIVLFGALGVATGAAAREPVDVVQALYAEPGLALGPDRMPAYFARDLDAALERDAVDQGRLASIGFDYRYGAQANQISGLQFIPELDNDQAKVVAVFKNFGKPNSVDWTLCRRADGDWKIVDATSNTGSTTWDLRQILGLPDKVRC